MEFLIGCLGKKERVKASEDLKQGEQVEISMEEEVGGTDTDVVGVSTSKRVLDFNLEDLLKAPAEVLKKGIFWLTLKAFLQTGMVMVVKRLRYMDCSETKFVEMVKAIEQINHENLLPFLAYYYDKDERLLVHHYMHMGSLSDLLHGSKRYSRIPLDFDTRIGIALGAARGIAHLHSQPSNLIISHGSIKSSNVLLTSSYQARVSDYGLAQFTGPALAASNHVDGYRAPEVIFTNQVSQKADVYSYGVLFLELLTGKNPNESHLKDEGLDLPRWMLSAINNEWTSEVFHVNLLQFGNLEEVLLQLLELAFTCTAHDPHTRPSMAEVVSRIEMLCSWL